MIKTTDVVDKRSNLIYVVPQSGEVKNLPEAHVDFVKHFQESDQKEDFIKTGKQYIFFVKEQDELEKMRVAGYNIRQKLDKKEDKLTLIGQGEASLALAEGFMLSNYQFLKYFKDKAEKAYALKELKLCSDVEAARVSQLNHVIQAVYWARDMVNEPVCYLTAEKLAEEMQRLGQETNIKVTVFDKAKIEELKMGGLLAVNRGSVLPPTFTVMEYKPENPVNKKPIVLVGKGLVFDTGGLSLKPTQGSMDSMKSDMGGAACMIGAIYAAALNKLDVHIISLIPSTDNRPGQNAYTPGDIITMFDGTTIEVMNTDAEGRMILADAIAYADKYDPEVIIDAATLTGAALVVAGNQAACIMGNAEQKLMDQLIESGAKTHERLVQLPFWDDYKELLKSPVADMRNVGGRLAGTITAGKFLEHFAKQPYVHLDIAGPAFYESEVNYKGIGGTGTGVRTLAHFFANYKA